MSRLRSYSRSRSRARPRGRSSHERRSAERRWHSHHKSRYGSAARRSRSSEAHRHDRREQLRRNSRSRSRKRRNSSRDRSVSRSRLRSPYRSHRDRNRDRDRDRHDDHSGDYRRDRGRWHDHRGGHDRERRRSGRSCSSSRSRMRSPETPRDEPLRSRGRADERVRRRHAYESSPAGAHNRSHSGRGTESASRSPEGADRATLTEGAGAGRGGRKSPHPTDAPLPPQSAEPVEWKGFPYPRLFPGRTRYYEPKCEDPSQFNVKILTMPAPGPKVKRRNSLEVLDRVQTSLNAANQRWRQQLSEMLDANARYMNTKLELLEKNSEWDSITAMPSLDM